MVGRSVLVGLQCRRGGPLLMGCGLRPRAERLDIARRRQPTRCQASAMPRSARSAMVRSASRSMTAVAMDCCAERGIVRPLSKARWTVRASRSARWSSPAVARLAVVDVAAAASAAARRNPSKVARRRRRSPGGPGPRAAGRARPPAPSRRMTSGGDGRRGHGRAWPACLVKPGSEVLHPNRSGRAPWRREHNRCSA